MSPLEEDFSDVAGFVQEDTSDVEDNASDDEVERKIAQEHAKYKEAQAKRQEEVRAARPWSTPPVESPRPEQQKEREIERRARASMSDSVSEAPRAEYEPPTRPYLLQAQASGGSNLSYMSRPQSAEHRRISGSGARVPHAIPHSPASLTGIEEEAPELHGSNSRHPSDAGLSGVALGNALGLVPGALPDNIPGRDQYGAIAEDVEGEAQAEAEAEAEAEGDGVADATAAAEASNTAAEEVEAEGSRFGAEVNALEASLRSARAVAEADAQVAAPEESLAAAEVDPETAPSGEVVGLEASVTAEAGAGELAAPEESLAAAVEAEADAEVPLAVESQAEAAQKESSVPAVAAEETEALREAPPSGDTAGGEEPYVYSYSYQGLYGGKEDQAPPAEQPSREEEDEVQGGAGERDTAAEWGAEGDRASDTGAAAPEAEVGGAAAAEEADEEQAAAPEAGVEVELTAEASGTADRDPAAVGSEAAAHAHGEASDADADGNGVAGVADGQRDEEEVEAAADVLDAARAEAEAGAAERSEDAVGGNTAGDWAGGDAAADADDAYPAPSMSAHSAVPSSLAMRGFVEPLPFEQSYGAASQGRPSAAAAEDEAAASSQREPAAADADEQEKPGQPGDLESEPRDEAEGGEREDRNQQEEEEEEDEYEEDYEDSFESYVPDSDRRTQQTEEERTTQQGSEPAGSAVAGEQEGSLAPAPEASLPAPKPAAEASAPAPAAPSREPSAPPLPFREPSDLSRSSMAGAPAQLPPLAASNSAKSLPPLRPRATASAASAAPEEEEEDDDDKVYKRAAAAAVAANGHRAGGDADAAAGGMELLPPQQFAMQLLKHDIDVLPQHHRAAAEAAAARRKPSSARPAGAGLAAFGYLGYHVVHEDLTAAAGPTFRNISPSRAGAGAAAGPPAPAGSDGGDVEARPTSAPHMRPNGASGGGAGGAADRAARLPPVNAALAVRASSGGGGVPLTERSLSVLEEEQVEVSQTRMKFDVWLDALGAGGAVATSPPAPTGGGAAARLDPEVGVRYATGSLAIADTDGGNAGRRAAHGLRRPMSARAGAGLYGVQPPPAMAPRPLGRPMSAQPHHLRPASAGRSRTAQEAPSPVDVIVPVTIQPLESSAAGGGTAAVDVAGVTVSVYVADTLKRIVEANRWLQQLGVASKRYRLKDRYSNMMIQLVEELPPMASEQLPYEAGGAAASGGVAVVKELTLKQFLGAHANLRQQVKKLRSAAPAPPLPHNAGQAAVPPLPVAESSKLAASGAGGGGGGAASHRPFSAGPTGPPPASSRVRPASARPYSGGGAAAAAPYTAAPAAAAPGPGATAPAGRPARPSSAHPAYGRTPLFNIYSSGGSPPGGAAAAAPFTGLASYAAGGAAGKLPSPRPAWSAAPGSGGATAPPPHHPYAPAAAAGGSGGAAAAGYPYMNRSISAAPRTSVGVLDDEEPEQLLVTVDGKGDISRVVKQQLGGATDYCQAKRNEIARLRNMPLM